MKTSSLGFLACAFLLAACGGEDAITIPTPDSGGSDTGTGNDTGTGSDTGTDTGTGTDGSVGDAGSGDAIAVDGGGFQVGNVPGLVLWLNAGKGVNVNQGVDSWADQTTFKNDAKQTQQPRRPTLNANAINGQPAVHFDKGPGGFPSNGSMMVIADSVSMQWGTGDFFIITVARFDNNPADLNSRGVGLFFSKQAGQPNFAGPFLSGNIPVGNNGPANLGLDFASNIQAGNFVVTGTAYNNNAAHAFAGQRVGTKLDLRVDSNSIGTSTSSGVDVSSVGLPARIGADGDASFFRLNGDIAEMIAVKGVLSSQDQAGIQTYLKTKYNLP